MHIRFSHALLRSFSCLLLSSVLAACALFHNEPPKEPVRQVRKQSQPKPPPAPKIHYEMDNYVKQLSLLRFMLERNNADSALVKNPLSIIEGFAAEKQEGAVFQPVIIISYSVKGVKDIQQMVAPFKMSPNSADFPDLLEVMSQLGGVPYTMQDVHPAVVTSLPVRNLKFPADNLKQTRSMVNRELNLLLLEKASLTDIDEARVQLNLLQFFMAHRMRDAAYLAAENAKQSLAAAEDNRVDLGGVNALSEQLGLLESQLHRTMPFTLHAF